MEMVVPVALVVSLLLMAVAAQVVGHTVGVGALLAMVEVEVDEVVVLELVLFAYSVETLVL